MLLITLFILISFISVRPAMANDNIFGLHLTQTSDIHSASKIINSGEGEWGWATIVIRTDQLDHHTWQEFFDNCRRYHIIPLVRLATVMDNGYWKRPSFSDIDNLANFLDSLNWPTKDQHVILFNEINHGSEWGGSVDFKNFTDISIYSYQKFKELNPNFFIISAGLDLAAPSQLPQFESAEKVYQQIYSYRPEYFDHLDGLASHSYPNHGFVGMPSDTGRFSIQGYKWELDYFRSLNIQKDYPVFITETGWPHREGNKNNNNFYTVKTGVDFLTAAYDVWKQNSRIKAVTPFIYNYSQPPFDHFSWLKADGKIYPEYEKIINLSKNKNHPVQETSHESVKIHLPFFIITDTEYTGQIYLKNTGQSIWGETRFCLNPISEKNVKLDPICINDDYIEPNQIKIVPFKFKIESDNFNNKAYLSWSGLPRYEITPLYGSATIYRPKSGLRDRIVNYFSKIIKFTKEF